MTCSHKGCEAPATATVLAGATRVPYCFQHEREYADRYGSGDIFSLFVPSRFCTASCGKSQFEDWLHTPACEKAYNAYEEATYA